MAMGQEEAMLLLGGVGGTVLGYAMGRLQERVAYAWADFKRYTNAIRGLGHRVVSSTFALVRYALVTGGVMAVLMWFMVYR
jgi:multisubunit Na+/H+ antiporter MnhB subunit